MNAILVFFIAGAVIAAALGGRMAELNAAIFESARTAVTVAFGLIGTTALFLGLMNVLRDAGAVTAVARLLAPLLGRLFPQIPRGHPALGAIVMNVGANVVGLDNAATPFGLKAMQELERLNPHKGVASDSMALFLAINASGLSLFSVNTIAIRASLGSQDPAGILVPGLLMTLVNTLAVVPIAILLSRLPVFRIERFAPPQPESSAAVAAAQVAAAPPQADAEPLLPAPAPGAGRWAHAIALGSALLLLAGLLDESARRSFGWSPLSALRPPPAPPAAAGAGADAAALAPALPAPVPGGDFGDFLQAIPAVLSEWLIPILLLFIVLYGLVRGVKVYESAVQGAREAYDIFVMVVPFLVLILVAIGIFRASGALDLLLGAVAPLTSLLGFPAEALPMALVRPLSGSGARGMMTEIMTTYGPDSFIGYLVSVIYGSSETTFYVLAVYFGSVRVRAVRHTLAACLCADAIGLASALLFTRLLGPAA